jgi:uncharacterized membrane protein
MEPAGLKITGEGGVNLTQDPGTGHIQTLVDGVFAIAVTLLVLELIPSGFQEDLFRELVTMWPKFYAYLMGFLVLAIFWALHHSVFRYIRRSDEILLWLNILFLMFVALVPFSTAVLGQRISSRIAVVLYGGNMLVVSLSLSGIWWYATWRHRLVSRDISPGLVRYRRIAFLVVSSGFALGSGLAFAWPPLALGLFSLMALFYIASRVILYRHWGTEQS